MTTNEAINKVLSIARAEVGYHETCDNQTKYASKYDFDTKLYGFDMSGLPWCAYFISWIFIQAFGYDLGSSMIYQYSGCSGASCNSAASYFKSHNAFFRTPNVGDIVYFIYDGGINHTGIVESISGNMITTIEGNSSDAVSRNTYSVNNPIIAGYGRPAWNYAVNMDSSCPGLKKEEIVTELPSNFDFYSYLDIDSEFGPLTLESVTSFQKSHGLDSDGVVGIATWTKILSCIEKKTLREGNVGSGVTLLQAALNYISDCENCI